MKRIVRVRGPQISKSSDSMLPKKDETVAPEVMNFRREFTNITELITSTFSCLERKISFLDTKINTVSRVCSNILQHTENFIKDNKSSLSPSSTKCCQDLSNKIEHVNKILSSIADVVELLTAESITQKQNVKQEV